MSDTSAGFKFRGRTSGERPTIQSIAIAGTLTLFEGDMVYESSGELVLGATGQTRFLGVCLETKAGTAHVTKYKVIVDVDAIYGVNDNNARVKGATLDITGAAGAQGVATSSNKELVVYATKTNNSDETLVMFNVGKHLDNTAQ